MAFILTTERKNLKKDTREPLKKLDSPECRNELSEFRQIRKRRVKDGRL